MAEPKCSNCFMRGVCKAHSACEDWDGDCLDAYNRRENDG
uniref:Putative G-T mismatches repair enzyme n=1 Tax=Myoviridae sp. ctEtC12 TaxID=2825062 RepID=A0A8S5V3D7_9CAUD|nr:MAG TPA: putative G-T mismatches repair enzyme [Myoviridae sp. ctEtC12]